MDTQHKNDAPVASSAGLSRPGQRRRREGPDEGLDTAEESDRQAAAGTLAAAATSTPATGPSANNLPPPPSAKAQVSSPAVPHDAVAEAAAAAVKILWLDPATLLRHRDADKMPGMDPDHYARLRQRLAQRGLDPAEPIKLLPDGKTVLKGWDDTRAAIDLKLALVPCVIAESEDPFADMVKDVAHGNWLVLDQRVYLAVQFKRHLSTRLKSKRGRTARAARTPGAAPDKREGTKLDSMKEAVATGLAAERQIRRFEKVEQQLLARAAEAIDKEKAADEARTTLLKIRDGRTTVNKVAANLTLQQKQEDLAQRKRAVAGLKPIEGYTRADFATALASVEPGSVRLLLLRNDTTGAVATVLTAIKEAGVMAAESHAFALTDFVAEPVVRGLLAGAGFAVADWIVWDQGALRLPGAAKGPAGSAKVIIWATRGVGGAPDQKSRMMPKSMATPRGTVRGAAGNYSRLPASNQGHATSNA